MAVPSFFETLLALLELLLHSIFCFGVVVVVFLRRLRDDLVVDEVGEGILLLLLENLPPFRCRDSPAFRLPSVEDVVVARQLGHGLDWRRERIRERDMGYCDSGEKAQRRFMGIFTERILYTFRRRRPSFRSLLSHIERAS